MCRFSVPWCRSCGLRALMRLLREPIRPSMDWLLQFSPRTLTKLFTSATALEQALCGQFLSLVITEKLDVGYCYWFFILSWSSISVKMWLSVNDSALFHPKSFLLHCVGICVLCLCSQVIEEYFICCIVFCSAFVCTFSSYCVPSVKLIMGHIPD